MTHAPTTGDRASRLTVPELRGAKGGRPLVGSVVYTAPMARLFEPHVELMLVGDSVGMVLYGYDSPLPVTVEMMIAHGAAVVRATRKALVIVDLPWASYQESPAQAYRTAARVLAATGCDAVKLEGGVTMKETVAFLSKRGVPVIGHVGMQPQSVHAYGGFGDRGADALEADHIYHDAVAVAEAGAVAVVLEGVGDELADYVTRHLAVPTLGVGMPEGARPRACDGRLMVAEHLLGLSADPLPGHGDILTDLAPRISEAAQSYAARVRETA